MGALFLYDVNRKGGGGEKVGDCIYFNIMMKKDDLI